MRTIRFDINERHTLTRVGTVNDHNRMAVEFVGFDLEPEQTLFVVTKQRNREKVIPMTDNLWIVGKPLTLHPGDFKVMLRVRGGTQEWDTKWFTFRIDPIDHSHSCGCHEPPGDCCDLNTMKWVEDIKYRIEELEGTVVTEERIEEILKEIHPTIEPGYVTLEMLSQEVLDAIYKQIDYEELENKPEINNIILVGNKTHTELGINVPTIASTSDIDTIFI